MVQQTKQTNYLYFFLHLSPSTSQTFFPITLRNERKKVQCLQFYKK